MQDHAEDITSFYSKKLGLEIPKKISNSETLKTVYTSLPNAVDALLSKDLHQLSLTDRNAIGEEVHGVSLLTPEETPQFLEKSLVRLSEELDRIPNEKLSKASYLRSQLLPWTYVNSRDFRLRFLRSDLFDAKKAAHRIVMFLDIASELFGPDVLQRPIQMKDFPKGEEQLFRIGNVQVLPFRDRSGRPIFAWVGDFTASCGSPSFRVRIEMHFLCSFDINGQAVFEGMAERNRSCLRH